MLLSLSSAQASTLHVRQDGSNSNPCTQSAPCQTINHAISRMAGGDTLIVGGGTYREATQPLPAGSPGQPTILMAAPGEQVRVEPPSPAPDLSTPLLNGEADYVVIAGFRVDGRGMWGSCLSVGGRGSTYCGLELTGVVGQCVSGSPVDAQFLDLDIHDTGQYCHPYGDPYCGWRGYHHGVYLGDQGDNILLDGVGTGSV
jgi:hypothetical protein